MRNFTHKMADSKEATPTENFAKKSGLYALPYLIYQFMLIYYTHNQYFWVFFESRDRPVPRSFFFHLSIFLGKKSWERA